LYLDTKPDYYTKDCRNPIKDVRGEIKSVDDVKKMISTGIKKANAILPKYLKQIKRNSEPSKGDYSESYRCRKIINYF
jgi:hypothetical protein